MLIPILLGAAAVATIFMAMRSAATNAPASQQPGQPPAPGYPTYASVAQNTSPSSGNAAPSAGLVATGVGLSMVSSGLSMASQQQQQDGGSSDGGGPGVLAIAGLAVGAAGAIFGAMMAAHAKRLREATDENSAVNMGVKGFDADVAAISAAVNAKKISPAQAVAYIQQSKANFWALVSPKIQPGRNGCSGGSGCPGGQVGKIGPVGTGGTGGGCMTGQCMCTGSIGAACCVGCNAINGAVANLVALWSNTTRQPMQANICRVFASKYGGQDRAGYAVVFNP